MFPFKPNLVALLLSVLAWVAGVIGWQLGDWGIIFFGVCIAGIGGYIQMQSIKKGG